VTCIACSITRVHHSRYHVRMKDNTVLLLTWYQLAEASSVQAMACQDVAEHEHGSCERGCMFRCDCNLLLIQLHTFDPLCLLFATSWAMCTIRLLGTHVSTLSGKALRPRRSNKSCPMHVLCSICGHSCKAHCCTACLPATVATNPLPFEPRFDRVCTLHPQL
jgi:hypothetical protein